MKKVILLLCFMPVPALCQISENFESGILSDWTQSNSGRWAADNISSISGAFSLHHIYDNPEAGNDQAGVPLINLHPDKGSTKWSFCIRHGCDPSASNNWAVFLLADNNPLEMHPGGQTSGYAVGVNLTGSDDTLRLWKIKQGNPEQVVSSGVNWQTDIGIDSVTRIDVERSVNGIWKVDIIKESGAIIETSSGLDTEIFSIGWFGVYYKYSSTRDRLLWIDNITVEGMFFTDTVAPSVKEVSVAGKRSVGILLDDDVSPEFSGKSNFKIKNSGSESSEVIQITPHQWLISFPSDFDNKKQTEIIIGKICDNSMNCRENISVSFIPVWAEAGDIIISEIMPDPLPPVALPAKEYLELRNNSDFTFNLKNWRLIADGQTSFFPDIEINRGENLIVCDINDTALFSKYGKTTGIKSFPVLTDEGKFIVICDNSGLMIHGIEYAGNWYRDILKSDGGWSLEIIDTSYPFNFDDNWKASVSRTGGTPGNANSVSGTNRDRIFEGLRNVYPMDENSIMISFSEPVRNLSELGKISIVGGIENRSLDYTDLLQRKLVIGLKDSLKAGETYLLSLPQILTDYSGNRIEKRYASFGLPETATNGDIVFNELLFNPLTGFPDYIELINNSNRIIDASKLLIVSVNDALSDTSSIVQVSELPVCILPGMIYTITADRKKLIEMYSSSVDSNIFEVDQLPSMPDDKGHLILYNRQLDMLDEVRYSDDMHYPLLSQTEGVSLEKIRPEGSSMDIKNWHSASETSGWGTPGGPNSVFTATPLTEDVISFSSSRISPDNDGYEDLLVIDFNFEGYDNVLSVSIFDEGGSFVCKLAENLLAGSRASVTWDGTANNGLIVERGIYVVFISVYDYKGKTQNYKRVCSVIR